MHRVSVDRAGQPLDTIAHHPWATLAAKLAIAVMLLLLPYLLIAAVVIGVYLWVRQRNERAHIATHAEAVAQGLLEPPSLHPVVNPNRCIGSGGCMQACPEQALGIVGGKAMLVSPASCIGHGACAVACPVDAITLVFGSAKRGVDIPTVTPQFESNVPGLFIAGELGGMGLIRKAAEQGRQAMECIRKRKTAPAELDVMVIGAGPAGLSAGLSAIEHKLKYRLIDQESSLGGAIFHYPRQKIAMTAAVQLALVGKMNLGEVSKERLLEFWQGVVEKTGLTVHFNERMEGIEPQADARGNTFIVKTNKGQYHARSVLLAIGRRGSPRKLGVPGEDSSPKVAYRLIDPEQYQGQRLLVVGGGDSALEAAIALAAQPGTQVTLSYRGEAFSRVKEKNRLALGAAQKAGQLEVLLGSTPQAVHGETVDLQTATGPLQLAVDAVLVCAGGELPTALLQRVGIVFETKFGAA